MAKKIPPFFVLVVFGYFGPKWSIFTNPSDSPRRPLGEVGGIWRGGENRPLGPKSSKTGLCIPMQVAYTTRKALRAPQRGLLLIGRMDGWMDGGRWMPPKMAKNRPKMGASAPSFRDTPSKNLLGFFQPIWVGEKNWPFFRQTNQKNRKTPSGRFFRSRIFCLRKISCFWVPSGRFFENFVRRKF